MTVPAIAAMEIPDFLSSATGVSEVEDPPVFVGDPLVLVLVPVFEADGGFAVDEGDWLLRHELSLVVPTRRTSVLPPWRPRASTRKKSIEVPCGTFVVHVNEVLRAGGDRTTDLPPGIMA